MPELAKMTDAELVRECAEKVMGAAAERSKNMLRKGYTDEWRIPGSRMPLIIHSDDSPHIDKLEGWNPLTSDSDAFMVVDAMERRGYILCSLERRFQSKPSGDTWTHSATDWKCVFKAMDHRNEHCFFLPFAEHPDRRRAIVLAALAATEGR